MRIDRRKRPGRSYAKRVADINAIYDQHSGSGLSNREIWRRYIYPKYAISEATLYNILKAPATNPMLVDKQMSLFDFLNEKPAE